MLIQRDLHLSCKYTMFILASLNNCMPWGSICKDRKNLTRKQCSAVMACAMKSVQNTNLFWRSSQNDFVLTALFCSLHS